MVGTVIGVDGVIVNVVEVGGEIVGTVMLVIGIGLITVVGVVIGVVEVTGGCGVTCVEVGETTGPEDSMIITPATTVMIAAIPAIAITGSGIFTNSPDIVKNKHF